MSVRSDKVQVSVEIDAKKGISELGKLEMIQKDLVKSLASMKKEAEGYTEKALEIEKVNVQIEAQREKLGMVGMTLRQLKSQLGDLTKQQAATTFGTEGWDALQKKIQEVTLAIKQQENVKKGMAPLVDPREIKQLEELEEVQERMTRQLKQLGKASAEYAHTWDYLDDVNKEIQKHRNELGITGMTLGQLKRYYKDLENQIEGMDYGSEQWKKTHTQMRQVDRAVTSQTNKIKGLGGMWMFLKSEVAQMGFLTVGIMAVMAAFEAIKGIVSSNAELSDSFSDIEKATGMSNLEVERLNRNLKDLDTRTKGVDLRKIAVIGGQLGVPNEELESFIKNVDRAVVALGDEFQGGAEEVAKELGSLQKLFKETKAMDTGEAINDIGSAINTLGANGSATGPVIADFAKRLGALGELGPNISQTLGLGAALQELGLTAEQASGGITGVLLNMNKQSDLFAKFMGKSSQEFKTLMQNNPNEMLLELAERFKGASSTSIVQTMEKLGINSQEAVKVVALLSNQTDIVREKQELANKAMQEGTSLSEEFAKKNDNLAAKLEKLGKQLVISFVNSAVAKGMEAIVDGLLKITASADSTNKKFEKWKEQAEKVKNLEGSFSDLVDEYERLSSKTVRTTGENERLQIVIDQIAKTVPTAVTEFDKYGKALGINTEAARKFVAQQKAMAAYNNKDAIKAAQKDLKQFENERNNYVKTMNSGYKLQVSEGFDGKQRVQSVKKVPLTNKEISDYSEKVAALNSDILALQGNLAELRGEKTETEKALDKELKTVTEIDFENGKSSGKSKPKTPKAKKAEKPKDDWEIDVQAPLREYQEFADKYWETHFANIENEFERERKILERNYTQQLKDLQGSEAQKALLEVEMLKDKERQLADISDREKKAQHEKELAAFQKRASELRAASQVDVVRAGMELDKNPESADARDKFKGAQIKAIEVDRDLQLQELEQVKGSEAEKQLIIAESEDAIAQIRAQHRDQEKEKMVQAAELFADIMANMINALSSFAQAAAEADMQRVENRKQKALAALDEEYQGGTMRKAKYEKEKAKIEKDADEKLKKIKNEQAKKDREAQIAQTIIQGSIAVLSASQNPLGILAPQAVATAIAAGLQLATVVAQPLPQYAEGGMTGRSIAAGGYQNSGPFIASMNEEGVEYVVPNYLLKEPIVADYVGVIESMRSGNHYGGKYAEGGYGPGNRSTNGTANAPLLAGAIGSATDQALLEQITRLNNYLENPTPAQAIFDYDYFSRSTAEIEQVKQEAIAA